MRRLVRHVRRRAQRWPEETQMMIAGAITITLIFGLVIGASKIWPPANGATPSAVEGGRK